jgi:hypothetical protein
LPGAAWGCELERCVFDFDIGAALVCWRSAGIGDPLGDWAGKYQNRPRTTIFFQYSSSLAHAPTDVKTLGFQ